MTNAQKTTMETRLAGEDLVADRMVIEQRNSYLNVTTATTTVVKSGDGVLHAIVVNKAVGSATITIYDNTAASGTKIGTITFPATITGADQQPMVYNAQYTTGLTVVTSGATDLTIVYR